MKSLGKAILLLAVSGFLASCACAGYEVRSSSSSQPQSSQTSSAESSQKVSSSESEEDSEEDESEEQVSSSQQQSSQQTSQSSSQQTSQSSSQQTSSQTSQSSSQQTSSQTSQSSSQQTSQSSSQQTSESSSQQTSQQTSEQTSEQTSSQSSQSSSQEEDTPVTLSWGNSTSIADKQIKIGETDKLVTLVLKATEEYTGNLRIWVDGDDELKPYLSVKVIKGDVESVDGGTTIADLNPGTGFDRSFHLQGTVSGASYSVFASFSSGMAYASDYAELLTKSVSIHFDWAKFAE